MAGCPALTYSWLEAQERESLDSADRQQRPFQDVKSQSRQGHFFVLFPDRDKQHGAQKDDAQGGEHIKQNVEPSASRRCWQS